MILLPVPYARGARTPEGIVVFESDPGDRFNPNLSGVSGYANTLTAGPFDPFREEAGQPADLGLLKTMEFGNRCGALLEVLTDTFFQRLSGRAFAPLLLLFSEARSK